MPANPKTVKIALLDLYLGEPNGHIQNIIDIVDHYASQHRLSISLVKFGVRDKNEIPDTSFDVYIASGGPGSPIDSKGLEWEQNFFGLFKQLEAYNTVPGNPKKHSLLICHSFQLMCRERGIGDVNKRHEISYGIVPLDITTDGRQDTLFNNLPPTVYALDSRYWQVVHATEQQLAQAGAQVLAVEDESSAAHHSKALMAVRFSPYIAGVQFHPEEDPTELKDRVLSARYDSYVIEQYGFKVYERLTAMAADESYLQPMHNGLIPAFLDEATQPYW